MKPTYSDNKNFITFIADNENRPIFFAKSEQPFEALAMLSSDLDTDTVIQIINLMDKAYCMGMGQLTE